MTRKGYIAITASIAATRRVTVNWPHPADVLDGAARGIAELFGRENARFDRVRFLRECGVPEHGRGAAMPESAEALES